jgi:hypothetical protein
MATGAWDATITAAGRWTTGEAVRFRQIRLRISAYTSGSLTVNAFAEPQSRYMAVEGDNASGVADQGNPVKIGGYASSAAPTAVTAGQRANAWFGLRGSLTVVGVDIAGNLAPNFANPADATTNAQNLPSTMASLMGFNGATWERVRTANTGRLQVDVVTGGGSPAKSTTGTPTNVASSASDVTILASNASRIGAMIMNDSTAVLYLLVGAGTSSVTNYSVKIAAGGYWELQPLLYTGILKGIWASANGYARVTEMT